MSIQLLKQYQLLCEKYKELDIKAYRIFIGGNYHKNIEYSLLQEQLQALDSELTDMARILDLSANPDIKNAASEIQLSAIHHSVAVRKGKYL